MKHLRWLVPLLIFVPLGIYVLQGIHRMQQENPEPVLTSPHGHLMYPLSFELPDGAHYYDHKKVLQDVSFEPQQYHWAVGVSVPIATALVYLATALFLYFFSRLRRLEKSFLLFSIFLLAYLLSFLDHVSLARLPSAFFLIALFINVAFVYFFRSLLSLSTRPLFYFISLPLLFGLYWAIWPESAAEEKVAYEVIATTHLGFLLYVVFLWFYALVYRRDIELTHRKVHLILALTALIAIAIPGAGITGLVYFSLNLNLSHNVLFFIPTIFPMFFFATSMRYGIVYFEVPVWSSFVRLFYFIFFSLAYWFTIGFHLIQIADGIEDIWLHVGIILVILLALDPLRTVAGSVLSSYLLDRRRALDHYLRRTSQYVNNPRQITPFIENLLRTVQEAMQLQWVRLVFARDVFSSWHTESQIVFFLESDHPVWFQTNRRRRALGYPAFTQTAVGPIRDLLQMHGGFLLMCFQNFNAAIMLSQKKEREPFTSEDVRFLRTVLKQTEPLLENYRVLVQTIELRRRETELELAARIQRKGIPTYRKFPHLEFVSAFDPSVKVTGDYIEFLQPKPNVYFVCLGDISGHGLGSAYLMAIVRAFLRGSLALGGYTLAEALENLNDFFISNYKGSDFMTLFSIQMIVQEGNVELSYVNAGQHAALLYDLDREELHELSENQRVLGVVPTQYEARVVNIDYRARLYLYSDGAFEIFGKEGKMLGQKRLSQWIKSTLNLNLHEQISALNEKVQAYYKRAQKFQKEEKDDISIIAVEINPTDSAQP